MFSVLGEKVQIDLEDAWKLESFRNPLRFKKSIETISNKSSPEFLYVKIRKPIIRHLKFILGSSFVLCHFVAIKKTAIS